MPQYSHYRNLLFLCFGRGTHFSRRLSRRPLSPVSAESRLIPFLSVFFLFVPLRSPNLAAPKFPVMTFADFIRQREEGERERERAKGRQHRYVVTSSAVRKLNQFPLLSFFSKSLVLFSLPSNQFNAQHNDRRHAGTRALVIRDQIIDLRDGKNKRLAFTELSGGHTTCCDTGSASGARSF